MRRLMILAVLVAVGAVSIAVAASQQAQAPKTIEVQKLKDNLFMLTGGGGNTAVFVMANGVAVVDTKNPGWGTPLLDKIRELTSKPVTTIINTHTHGDHVSGNVEFPTTVEVIAHENTKANMEKMIPNSTAAPTPGPPPNIFKENNGKNLPKRTFKDKMSVGTGNDQIDLYYFGRGHTNGDAWVVFPVLRVLHAADMFSGKNIPLLDGNNGGSGVAYADTLTKAFNGLKNIDMIITGHSTVMTMNDLKEYADFNREFLMAMQEAKKAGRTVDEVAKSWKMPAKYTGYAEPIEARLHNNVQVTFNELK